MNIGRFEQLASYMDRPVSRLHGRLMAHNELQSSPFGDPTLFSSGGEGGGVEKKGRGRWDRRKG
jgi:glycerate-2-kinase